MENKEEVFVKVFIADDSLLLRKRLISMLADIPGIEVIDQARDAVEATNLIQVLRPDVVVLDIRLRGGNGIDVLQNIKKDNQNIIVIMLTSYPYPQYRKRCMEVGADFYFNKSDEFEKVVETLTQLAQENRV